MMAELMRRIHRDNVKGNTPRLGEIMKFYRPDTIKARIKWPQCREIGINSYKDAWNSNAIMDLRKSVGM